MPSATHPGAGRLLARRTVVLAVLYLAAGSAAALLQPPAVGSLFWPPAGIAVALLLVSPRRWWPVLLAAVGIVELSRNLLGGAPLGPSVLWAGANVLTPLVASLLARHWATVELARPRRVAVYLLAIVVGAGAGALVGAAGTVVVGASTPYPLLVATWLVGDALGVLIVSPFLLLVLGQFRDTRLTLRDALSVIATVVLAVAAVGVVMTSVPQLRLLYLLVLPMAWVATRWRLAGAELRNLEALAEDRARLLAAVSHELRTPLTSSVGFSEHLLEHSPTLSEPDRVAIAAIDRNGRHLTRLIEELLQVRQTRRNVEARPEPVDLVILLPSLVTDRRSSTGLGPGLAIARQLARANGGDLLRADHPWAAEAARAERVGAAGGRA